MTDQTVGAPTSPAALEAGGQGERTSAQPAAAAPAQQDKQAKPNWFQDPEFKRIQSNWTRAQEELRAQNEAIQRQLEEERRARMTLEERGLSDFDKVKLQLQREAAARRQLEEENQRYKEYLEGLEARRRKLDEVSEKYDIPRHVLEDVWDPDLLMDKVIEYKTEQARQAALAAEEEEEQQRREANLPDLGGARSKPRGDSREEAIRKALDSGDNVAYVKAVWDSGWS